MTLTTLIDGRRDARDLTDGTYVIGRGESCRVRIDLPDVSERHAILTVRGDRAIIEDLHSSNGPLVNGEPIDQAVVLDSGKVVQVGSSLLRVSDGAADAVAPAEQEFAEADGGAEGTPGDDCGAACRRRYRASS